jgi:hypothetical protein
MLTFYLEAKVHSAVFLSTNSFLPDYSRLNIEKFPSSKGGFHLSD